MGKRLKKHLLTRTFLLVGLAVMAGCGKFSTVDHSGEPGLRGGLQTSREETAPSDERKTQAPRQVDVPVEISVDDRDHQAQPAAAPAVTEEQAPAGESAPDSATAPPATTTAPSNPPATGPAATPDKAPPDSQKPAAPSEASKASAPAVAKNADGDDEEKPNNSILFTKVPLAENEIAESGYIRPTIYDFPIFNEDKGLCDSSEELLGAKGNILLKVCQKTLSACGEEGSCAIIQDGVTHSLNILTRKNGKDRFFEIGADCPFGYGVQNICLDPFYTLAADLKVYKPGDIIYVPGVNGLDLPNGTKHDGYFVIRDEGRGINGKGRFDFFSGYYRWSNPKNPFAKLGLGSISTRVPYYKIKGPRAESIRHSRSYPKLPSNPIRNTP